MANRSVFLSLCSPSRRIHRHPLLPFALLALLAACDDSPSAAEPRDCGGGEMRLRVGEALNVAPDVRCMLRPQEGAEYALAWYDVQLLSMAEAGPEPYGGLEERLGLAVIEGDGSVRSTVPAPALALDTPPSDTRVTVGRGPSRALGVLDAKPWSEGEVIRFGDPICPAGCTGRVALVVDGWLVLAVEEATLGADTELAESLLRQAAPLFREHALPLLRDAFTPELPVNGPESGQLVALMRGDVSPVGGFAMSNIRDGVASHLLQLEMSPGIHLGSMLSLLTHEVAHAFQMEYLVRSAPPGGTNERTAARWGVEGGATLIEFETVRRASGRGFAANLDFRVEPTSEVERAFLRHAAGSGALVSGYGPAAALLLELTDRRIRAGDDLATALREVSRGAMEGWYGRTVTPPGRQGLVQRMQARVRGWNPEEALLTWALSAAADDHLSDAEYQNRHWLRMGDADPARSLGWGPFRQLVGGSNRSELFSGQAGSAGWVLLRDPGAGITFQARSVPSVRWRLLRIN